MDLGGASLVLLAFAVGFIYDYLNVGFMYSAVHGRAWTASKFSMLVGSLGLLGIVNVGEGSTLAEKVARGAATVAGYGLGTYIAVKFKKVQHGN